MGDWADTTVYTDPFFVEHDSGLVETHHCPSCEDRYSVSLTPDQARELARLLRKHARLAEGQEVDE